MPRWRLCARWKSGRTPPMVQWFLTLSFFLAVTGRNAYYVLYISIKEKAISRTDMTTIIGGRQPKNNQTTKAWWNHKCKQLQQEQSPLNGQIDSRYKFLKVCAGQGGMLALPRLFRTSNQRHLYSACVSGTRTLMLPSPAPQSQSHPNLCLAAVPRRPFGLVVEQSQCKQNK